MMKPPKPSVIVWTIAIAAACAGFIWFIAKDAGVNREPFIQPTFAPDLHGYLAVPDEKTTIKGAILIIPDSFGYTPQMGEQAARFNKQGMVTLIFDYFRGGRDSYHGAPNEISDKLTIKWQENISSALTWVTKDSRFAHFIVVTSGRGTQLVAAVSAGFPGLRVIDANLPDEKIMAEVIK